MPEQTAIRLVVLSRQQDAVESINSTLRNAGHPVHCTWVTEVADLQESLNGTAPQLIFCCLPEPEDVVAVAELRNRLASAVPLVLVRESLAEADLSHAVSVGAQDVVTLHARDRLRAIAERELNAVRLDHVLSDTLASARRYHEQMRSFMAGSADAIAHVQEGIVVDVNPAWLDLFGRREAAELVGQPLMDGFAVADHAALKGAIVAATHGRWAGHPLQAACRLPDGELQSLDLQFETADFDGDPAVRLRVATYKREQEALARQLQEALRLDSGTGLMKRSVFLEFAGRQAAQALKGGQRFALYLELDKDAALEKELGVLGFEDLIDAAGSLLQSHLQAGDVAARVSPRGFAALLERGNTRDLDAWIERLLQRLAEQVFHVGERSISATGSLGVAACDPQGMAFGTALQAAVKSRQAAATAGGNRFQRHDSSGRAEIEGTDRIWAGQIRAALMANRFRLVQQPIASLVGDDAGMFDLVVRMLDEKGREVLPSEFFAAAERTDLLKNIDRWVVGAAISFCRARSPKRVFVRLSRDSLRDASLGPWLQQQLRASTVEAERVVFEVSEELATQHVKETRELQKLLRGLGFGFALESFGAGRNPTQLLQTLQVDYVKIDGALMQGLAGDAPLQEQVRALVDSVRSRGIITIAERVEDANTMAVLWQLGIEFVQGYFVSAPEDVVLG